MDLHWLGHSWISYSAFLPFYFFNWLIMRCYDIRLLLGALKLDFISAFIAAGAGLLVFKWSLRNVLLLVVL